MKSKPILLTAFSRSHILFTRYVYFILLGALILLLNSCSAPSTVKSTAVPTHPVTPSTQTPSLLEVQPTTGTPDGASTLHPSNAKQVIQVCSPLAIQPLDKISEIITQAFSMPLVMVDGTYSDGGHHGLDIGFVLRGKQRFLGTPVLAALEGKVASIIHNRPPYGNMVMLETSFDHIPPKIIADHNIAVGESIYIVYGHLQNLQPINVGDVVKCGHQIAEAGLTGITSGPHLHFETRWGPANAVFPLMGAYRGDITPEEMYYYKIWRMSHSFQLFNPIELLNP